MAKSNAPGPSKKKITKQPEHSAGQQGHDMHQNRLVDELRRAGRPT